MIEFATFLLGLVTGIQEVELVVDPRAPVVEVFLDGRSVAELKAPPYRREIDFGPALEPHLLKAIARDPDGRELGRVEQWVNRPRGQVAASLIVLPGQAGKGRVAQLRYQSVQGDLPERVTVTFDGAPLAAPDPRRIEIPSHDPASVHFLRAEVDFAGGLSAVADAFFGGPRRDETGSELTAVAVSLAKGARLPPPAAMGGFFRVVTDRGAGRAAEPAAEPVAGAGQCGPGAEGLTVVSVEEGPAEVVVVVDESARSLVSSLFPDVGRSFGTGRFPRLDEVALRRERARLKKEQILRLVQPFPAYSLQDRVGYQLFGQSEDVTRDDGGLVHVIAAIRWRPRPLEEQRLRDALSVAALSATRRDRRRAVVLILGPDPKDQSTISMGSLRHYLASVGVPLHVWSAVQPAPPTEWGAAVDVSTFARFEDAVSDLVKSLERQRIVWVEGKHLPQSVGVTACAKGIARLG